MSERPPNVYVDLQKVVMSALQWSLKAQQTFHANDQLRASIIN